MIMGIQAAPKGPKATPPSTRDGLVPHYVYEMLVVGGQPTHQTNHYWRGHLQVGKKTQSSSWLNPHL
jgi:beta-glucanase (GH16 family)